MKKTFLGIIIFLAGIALAMYAFLPGFSLAGISVWKIIITVLIVAFIIKRIIFGDTISQKINHFIPIALLAIIYRSEITALTGADKPFSVWIVLIAAVMLTVATSMLCHDKKAKNGAHINKMSASTIYLDATKVTHKISDKFSAREVYFQNTDSPDVHEELILDIEEKYSATEIYVPADWFVDWRVDNRFSSVEIRPNPESYSKKLIITGTVKFGAIEVN